MPTPGEILAGLARIADEAFAFAVAWHVLVGAVLIALLAGWRPSRRLAASALAAPLASVSVFGWAYGNPFNGTMFALFAAVVAVLGARAPRVAVAEPAGWTAALGVAMVAYAWVYPHFLAARPFAAYLVGAPMGLVPCPTLSLVIGLALLTGVPGDRAWTAVLAGAGLLYALFGAFRLGVWLDLGLLAGAAALGATLVTLSSWAPPPRSTGGTSRSLPS